MFIHSENLNFTKFNRAKLRLNTFLLSSTSQNESDKFHDFVTCTYHEHRKVNAIFLFLIEQANACLDLLVRSFNEVFSPMIETGDVRIRKPHQVDDLTDYYKIDDSGDIIPNSEFLSSRHFTINQAKSRSEDEEILLQPRNPNPLVEYRTTPTPGSDDRESSPFPDTDNDMMSSSPIPQNVIRKKYKHRGGYTPGRRPFVDFFIKLIEEFQLTANAKFITSRPRYGNGQLQYDIY